MSSNASGVKKCSRTVSIRSGPSNLGKGDFNDAAFSKYISGLGEVRPGTKPKNLFMFLKSPRRNGNSTFMRSVIETMSETSPISTIAVPQSAGVWDSSQYPRLLEGIAPEYRISSTARSRLRQTFMPFFPRLLSILVDYGLAIVWFVLSSLIFSTWFSLARATPGTSFGALIETTLDTLAALPLWSYGVSFVFSVALEVARRKTSSFIEKLKNKKDPGYRIHEEDLSFLSSDDYAPIIRLFSRMEKRIFGPCMVWVDQADDLDQFSEAALCRLLLPTEQLRGDQIQQSNRIVILHFSTTDSPFYYRVRKHCHQYAHPEEYSIEADLQPVSTKDRIEVAIGLGKTEADARATLLIADLVEIEQLRRHSILQAWTSLIDEEDSSDRHTGPGLLLVAMASAGKDGPRQFTKRELREVFTKRKGDFARFLSTVGKEPPYPAELDQHLKRLLEEYSVPLVSQRRGQKDVEWAVDPEVRQILLGKFESLPFWASGIHSFWAPYIAKRINSGSLPSKADRERNSRELSVVLPDHGLDQLVELVWHLMRIVLPASEKICNQTAMVKHIVNQIAAVNCAIPMLIKLAQFDLAHRILERIYEMVVQRSEGWISPSFIREVERLSKNVWRLATVRGASDLIVSFQLFISDRGARSASKGISASVAIFEAYNRAIRLQEIDVSELQSIRIAGGDQKTRTFLSNMRNYTCNIALLRKHALVIECLELSQPIDIEIREKILIQVQDPFPSATKFDFFEYLVADQYIRVLMSCDRFQQAISKFDPLVDRLFWIRTELDKDDVLEEAFWNLALAIIRLLGLDVIIRIRGALFLIPPETKFVFARLFGIDSNKFGFGFDVIDKCLDSTEESIEDAEFLQQLCGVSLGKVCLLNAQIRYKVALSMLNKLNDVGELDEILNRTRGEAQSLKCNHLAIGALASRARIRQGVETCASCLKALALEALKAQLDEPLRLIAPMLVDTALLLHDDSLYEVAAEVLGYLTCERVPNTGTNYWTEWVKNRVMRGQFLRLLNKPQECLAELSECTEFNLDDIPSDLQEAARHIQNLALLQACWCHEQMGQLEANDQLLERVWVDDHLAEWQGYPHFVVLKMKCDLAVQPCINGDELINKALDITLAPRFRSTYDNKTVFSFLSYLMSECFNRTVSEETKIRVVFIARQHKSRVGEWVGLKESIRFLNAYLKLVGDQEEEVLIQYESLVAREAMSASRLKQLQEDLQRGTHLPLLEYIFDRFSNRIVCFDDLAQDGKNILKQVEQLGPDSLSQEQFDFCLDKAQIVQLTDGKIAVHMALMVLRKIGSLSNIPSGTDPRIEAVEKATGTVVRKILWNVVHHRVVDARLAQAMEIYLRACDAMMSL